MFKQHSQTDCTGKVGFPYDTSLMFFWEFYSMNMPTFVPSSALRTSQRSCFSAHAATQSRRGSFPTLALGRVRLKPLCVNA